ncbi:MAG: guanylate kinase, partial [Pseudoflavonifractor sp.]
MKRKQLKIGVDVDDVLYNCNQHAIDLLCVERECTPMSIYDIPSWGCSGSILDARLAYFSRADFVQNQPILPGAQDFIRKLSQRGEVIFTTAVGSSCMSARAERLMHDFPEISERNIMIGARKDLLALDFLLDDGAHNILNANAKYPVLFRRPWNEQLTGLLSVNSFDDFIQLVDRISAYHDPTKTDLSKGGIVCLVGPTGSGKTAMVEAL